MSDKNVTMKILPIILLVLILSGCSKGFSYNPYTNEKFTSSVSQSEIQVLFDNPKYEYLTIGFIDYDFYQPGFSSPTISEAIPSLKSKVHDVGGDAIIVRDTKTGLGWDRNLRIIGDVIKLKK